MIPQAVGLDVLHHRCCRQRPTVVEINRKRRTSTAGRRVVEVFLNHIRVIDCEIGRRLDHWMVLRKACAHQAGSDKPVTEGVRSGHVIDVTAVLFVVRRHAQRHRVAQWDVHKTFG